MNKPPNDNRPDFDMMDHILMGFRAVQAGTAIIILLPFWLPLWCIGWVINSRQ